MTTFAANRAVVTVPDRQTSQLHNLGAAVGALLPGKPRLREMVLPSGWTVTRCGGTVRAHDQHGRRRLHIGPDVVADRLEVRLIEPGEHAQAVAEGGATLVLDKWATPGALLGPVGERIDTYQRLVYVNESGIDRWQDEQPGTAARYRDELVSYRAKLAAYTGLLQKLTEAITSGWTPEWTDQQTHVHYGDCEHASPDPAP
ncbi:hypothetical protein ACIRF8_15230 [Streptomyces sp. NPDC102406]|uniref:hypothetical protein n=1 Tax=Streptomyces sp. NPDC102406 TaxID=3366171 RepID=UPI0038245645